MADTKPKILVAIASHGTKNLNFLKRLLDQYRSMSAYHFKVVVHSNIPKYLGDDVDVVVEKSPENSWSLTFAHKSLFAKNRDKFEFFIYSEDDTLICQSHIDAFVDCCRILPDDLVCGFMRYEIDAKGNRYVSSVHSHFHWDESTVMMFENDTFAHFTNNHSGCYLLTQKQLGKAIDSGMYLHPPERRKLGIPETAATDPYTECGMRKVICISRMDEFVIHHLPNIYYSKIGLDQRAHDSEINFLMRCPQTTHGGTVGSHLMNQSFVDGDPRHKIYYERDPDPVIHEIPKSTRTVLSLGCGNAVTESAILEMGMIVHAVPLSASISVHGARSGVMMLPADLTEAFNILKGQQYECIIVSHLLHLLPDPIAILKQTTSLMAPNGLLLASVPQLGCRGVDSTDVTDELPGVNHCLKTLSFMSINRDIRSKVHRAIKQAGLRVVGSRHVAHGKSSSDRIKTAVTGRFRTRKLILKARRFEYERNVLAR